LLAECNDILTTECLLNVLTLWRQTANNGLFYINLP